MRRALVTLAACVLTAACSSPAPREPTPRSVAAPVPTQTPAAVQVQAAAPQPLPSTVVRAVASPSPASMPLSVLAGRSGADLRVSLDQALEENAYLTAAVMQAASNARLDELIGASTMLDQSTLNVAEIVGNVKGANSAQVLADAWRAQTTDLIVYSQAQRSAPPTDLDQQRTVLAAQLAMGDFSEEAAETILQRRTQQELAVADSLASHDTAQATQRLATLVEGNADLSQPLAAAMASQLPDLLPPATTGADIDVRLRLGGSLLQHLYLSGDAIDAAADNRAADAQAYAAAAGVVSDDLGNQLASMYTPDVGQGVADRLRVQTEALVSAASGGDRHQASADIDRTRGEIDSLLSGANPLLAPGLLSQELRASEQPMLTSADAFESRDFATAYARLHEAARQSQKSAETLELAIVDRYPGRYLVLPTPALGQANRTLNPTNPGALRSVTTGRGPGVGPDVGPRVGPFGGRH
ncbi:MAG: hypothetical protein JOZ87_32670 [Chloroflexi bacterium]|nr:hypothetical protein [Chloroflexota bacterium]